MKTFWIRKRDNFYWDSGYTNETRTHTFPKHGARETLRNIEILLRHDYIPDDRALLIRLREQAEHDY